MTKEIDDWMTPEELAQELWGDYLGEGDMPEIAFNANTDWLKAIFIGLKKSVELGFGLRPVECSEKLPTLTLSRLINRAISMVKENENLTSRFGKMTPKELVSHLTNDNTHLACVTIILELLDENISNSYKMKRLNDRLEKELKEVTKDRNYYYKEVKHNMPQVRYDKSMQRQLEGLKERVAQDRKDLEALRKCNRNLEEKLRKRRNLTTKKPRKTRRSGELTLDS